MVSIGFNSHGSLAFWVQIAILGMSILVFLFGFGMTIYYFPSDFDITKAKFYKRLRSVCFATSKNDSTSDSKNTLNIESLREASAKRSEISTSSYSGTVGNLIVVVCLCVDKECLFELTCYIIGIVYFSLTQSGLAALRVFRVYRYLDYFNYFQVEVENDVPKENLPFSLTIAAQRCGFYMEQLYYEFFTQKSLGGMLVMAIFFFNAYVMAVIMFNQRSYLTLSSDFVTQPCYNINMCFVTMFRLVVYDGTGLDFLSALLEEKSDGLVFMLFVYMIFNAIILINGMIGIFGNTFTENDETGVKTLLEIRDLDEKVEKATMDIDSVVREMTGNQHMLVSICNKLGIDSGPLLAGKEIKTAKKVPNRPKYRLSINVGSVKSSIRESGDSEASSSTSRCEVTDPSVQMSTHQTSANVVKLG